MKAVFTRPFNQSHVLKLVMCLLCTVPFQAQTYAQGTWAALNHVAPHYNAGVMLLLTDGTVICKTSSGGSQGTVWDRLTPDNTGSYKNGTWTSIAAMHYDRLYFSSQVLQDGRVYVAGGEYGAGGPRSEVYNPLTNVWTMCPQIVTAHNISDANSEMLPDGRVLQAVVDTGGTRLCYIWDPTTNTYSQTASTLRGNNEAPWLKLPDQSILFLDNYSTTSERYMPATHTWINDAVAPVNLFDPYGFEAGGAFLLPDGRGFFIGSTPTSAYYTPTGTTAPGTWTAGPAIPGGQGAPDAASAITYDGHVLIAVSPTPTSGDHFPIPTAFYDFDYTTNTYTAVGAPGGGSTIAESSYLTNMLILPDGNVLFADQGDDQYYEYTPGNPPLAAAQPTVANVFMKSCDTFMATGTGFNGINEGASYGDDWQMETNYPIIRLKSGSNVYYCTTYHWNSTGVMRGGLPDTTTFVLPASLPAGTYQLEVVANGVPSADFAFNPAFTNSPTSFSECPGITTPITNTWTGGTWSTGDPTVATVDLSGNVTGVAAGTTTISYTIGTCVATTTVTVNFAAPPISPLGGANVCLGSSVSLTDGTPGGTWTSDNIAVASVGSSTGIVTGGAAGTANISYSIGSCSTVEPVTVNPLPAASIAAAGPTTFCAGGSVTLNATLGAGYTYQWQSFGTPISGATNSSYNATSAGNYSVIVTTSAGCAALSPVTVVTVNTPPPSVITPSGPTTFCVGGSVVLNASAGAGYTYQWQLGGLAIGGATNISYTASSAGNYAVTVTDGSTGCSTASATTTVSVNPLPAPITGTATVCVGATTTLSDISGGGTWSSSDVTVATVGSSSGIVTGMGVGGLATISYTAGSGCSSTIVVTVNSSTAAPISGPAAACISQTVTLTDVTPGGTWSSSNPAIASVGSATGIVTGVAAGSATIFYNVSTGCGSSIVNKAITVNAAPVVAPITGITTICPGTTSALSDATSGGVWSVSNPAVGTVSAAGVVTAIAIGVENISYSVTNLSGCTSSAVTSFTVFNPLSASVAAAGPTTFCTGGFVVLNASTGAGLTYAWQRDGVTIAGATTSTYTANTTGNYTVIVANTGGCTATSAAVVVNVNPSPIVVPAVTISASPDTTLCVTTAPVTFTALAVNGGLSPAFQWYVNGSAVGAGTSFGYTPTSGDIVKCVLTSSDMCAFPVAAADSVHMTISPLRTPSVSIIQNRTPICAGDTVKFSAVPAYGGTAPTYLWAQNGINVATGPDYFYIPHSGDVLVVTMTTNYPCVTTNIVSSAPYTVVVQPELPNILNVTVSQSSIVSGGVDTFTAYAPNSGAVPSYQWLINGSPVAGATNARFITHLSSSGEVISCEETSANPCTHPSTVISGGITVKVIPVGVQQLTSAAGSFTLMPNPNKGTFTIEGTLNDLTDQQVSISITDMLGQAIYATNTTAVNGKVNQQVMLDNAVANGMYLVSITCGKEHTIFHMVLNR